MSKTLNDYLSEIRKPIFKPRVKIELLYDNEEAYQEITGDLKSSDGSLTVNFQNGTRRSVSITLNNPTLKYNISPSSLWIKQKFSLSLGLQFSDDEYFWIPQGVFILQNPEVISNFSEKYITLKGLDKFALMDGQLGGELTYIKQLEAGMTIANAIKSILFSVGDSKPPIIDMYFNSKTLPYTLIRDTDSTYGDMMLDIAKAYTANVYYNTDGQLVFEQGLVSLNDTDKGSIWDFTTQEAEYLGSTISYPFDKLRSMCYVIGANVNGVIASARVINNNLQSETNVQIMGERQITITDDIISTKAEARDRAEYELKKHTMIQLAVTLKTVPLFHLDVNQVVTMTDETQGFNRARLLVQTINLPFQIGGQCDISCVNVNELRFGTL